jgi:TonB family protein
MSAQLHPASILSGRQLVLAVTIALHAAAISGLMAWRIAEVITRIPDDPIQIFDIKPDPPRDLAPVSNDPRIITAITVPSPRDPNVQLIKDIEEELHTVSATAGTSGGGETGSVVQDQLPAAADTPLQYRATRPSDDYYPPQAIRMEQEGVTIVRTCVEATGALSAAPHVVKSSRSRLLDGAAIAWAREALQFTPATHAGAAVPGCKEFRVNFTLH